MPNTTSSSASMSHQDTSDSRLEHILLSLAGNQSKLETIILKQNEMMTSLIESNNDRITEQSKIMTRQLLTLQEIAASKYDNSSDGISYDSTNAPLSQDPTITQNRSTHQKSAPPADNDAASITSVQTNVSQPLGYQDTKITIEKIDDDWLLQGTQSKIWFTQLVLELASIPY